ncbi:MAG: DUF3037 domain-containing protein [Mucilaginibacter polytrichastri]|nr:DUF3037 domain-containing protein [Mucilaginibacter polytrichastri]
MHKPHVFEYAVIRVVPRVEREEFLNAGVILYCRDKKYLDCLLCDDLARFGAVFPGIDPDEVSAHLAAIRRICAGGKPAGAIGELDMPSRFRWVTATRSTIIQASRVHPGLTHDPAETLRKLYAQLVEHGA